MPAFAKHQVMLDPATQALMNEVRPLSDYRLQYVNGRYPLLSLLYAVYAGGEHTLYCDHTDDFMRAYIVDSVPPSERPQAEERLKAISALLERLEKERLVQRTLPPAEQTLIEPTQEEWRLLGHALGQELQQADPPAPMW
jgi:hypothetical protein